MKTSEKFSRRSLFRGGVIAFGFAAVGGLAYHRSFQRKRQGEMPMLGKPIAMPNVAEEETMPFGFSCSPDGTKSAVLLGNLTTKELYISDYPAKTSSDYRLLARFPNCYKVDGISWCKGGSDQLLCRLTEINTGKELPPVLDEKNWRELGKTHISESDFFGRLCTVALSGEQETILQVPPSFEETRTCSTASNSDAFFLMTDEKRQKVIKCDFATGNQEVIYDLTAQKNKGAIHQIVYNTQTEEFVALLAFLNQSTKDTSYSRLIFNQSGEHLRHNEGTPINFPKNCRVLAPIIDAMGRRCAALTDRGIAYESIDSGRMKFIGTSDQDLIALTAMNSSDIVLLQGNNNNLENRTRTGSLPTLKDLSFRRLPIPS